MLCFKSRRKYEAQLTQCAKTCPKSARFCWKGCPGVVPMPFKDIGITLCQFLWK